MIYIVIVSLVVLLACVGWLLRVVGYMSEDLANSISRLRYHYKLEDTFDIGDELIANIPFPGDLFVARSWLLSKGARVGFLALYRALAKNAGDGWVAQGGSAWAYREGDTLITRDVLPELRGKMVLNTVLDVVHKAWLARDPGMLEQHGITSYVTDGDDSWSVDINPRTLGVAVFGYEHEDDTTGWSKKHVSIPMLLSSGKRIVYRSGLVAEETPIELIGAGGGVLRPHNTPDSLWLSTLQPNATTGLTVVAVDGLYVDQNFSVPTDDCVDSAPFLIMGLHAPY